MNKNNLYYYPTTSYTREEALQIISMFLARKLENPLKVVSFILVIVAAITLYRGEKIIAMAQEQTELYNQKHPYMDQFRERLSVEEMTWNYIDSLEVSEIETSPIEVSESEVEEISKPTLEYTQDDVKLLAQLMYAEEGVFFQKYSEDLEKVERVHKLAGSVVIHRAENNHMGYSTIKGTIYAEGQYAKSTIDRIEKGQDIPEVVYTWAEEILSEGAIGPSGLIFQSQFEQGDYVYDEIGNQIFCVEENYN